MIISIDLFLSSEFERVAKKISTMLSFKHDNLISLIGVCADGETPLLIMPFMSVGSVLDYVRNNKGQLLRNDQVSKEEVSKNIIVNITMREVVFKINVF